MNATRSAILAQTLLKKAQKPVGCLFLHSTRTTLLTTRRSASTRTTRQTSPSSNRSRPFLIFTALIATAALGTVATWYWYTPELRKYPKPVRTMLRDALYARDHSNDLPKAIKRFQDALDALLKIPSPPPDLTPDSRHVIGVMAQLAETLIRQRNLSEAADVYRRAFHLLVPSFREELNPKSELHPPTTPETIEKLQRAVGIAQHLGDVLLQLGRDDDAESFYVWSVRRLLSDPETMQKNEQQQHLLYDGGQVNEFVLPPWTRPKDIGPSIEALAMFYARVRRKYEFAVPLYLRALSLLEKDRYCHAAVLHNNIAEAYTSLNRFEEAQAWLAKGLDLTKKDEDRECEEACSVLLFNKGMIQELLQNKAMAEKYYREAREYAEEHATPDAQIQANRALRRLRQAKD